MNIVRQKFRHFRDRILSTSRIREYFKRILYIYTYLFVFRGFYDSFKIQNSKHLETSANPNLYL